MMQRCSLLLVVIVTLFLFGSIQAFTVPQAFGNRHTATTLFAEVPAEDANIGPMSSLSRPMAAVTAALTTTAMVVLPALAETATDDYEYGAVNAPIGIAWAAGVLAILTALLPLALQGGEKAFEEIKERDKDTFNKM